VAAALSGAMKRSTDFVARYGGEEFVVVLPDADANGAMIMAEALRVAVEACNVTHEYSKVADHVTISSGIASVVPQRGTEYKSLIVAADGALYEAKEGGRNRFHVAPEADNTPGLSPES
jgi:diguanylate cyclase (GGDEF)-like protein